MKHSVTNGGDPDQMAHSAVSALGLHCLPMSHKKDSRLIWVKSKNPLTLCILISDGFSHTY